MGEFHPIQILTREIKRKLAAPKGRGWKFKTNVSPVNTGFDSLEHLRAMKRDPSIEMDEHRSAFDEAGRRLPDAKAVYTRRK